MDIVNIIETFGLPVAMVIALGFYISKKDKSAEKQNKYIQDELSKELRESFTRIENIIIALINQQKKMQIEMRGIKKQYETLSEIITKLSGNGLSHLFKDKKK